MSSVRRGSARKGSVVDDEMLATLGHAPELSRGFTPIAMLGLAFAILNSWTALAASLSLALPSGGPTSVLWGLITAGICNLCLAASMAEFLSAYPTAGGQYHWVAMVAWKPWVPILSWITGWINVAGWIALTATAGLLGAELIVGVIALEDSSYTPKRWHEFLIYIGYALFAFLVNAYANRLLDLVNKAALYWSLGGFAIICVTVLSTASPNYASAEYVFTKFINQTGWPDGVSWLLGLLQGGFGLTAYDAVAHMIEEIPNATTVGPMIMIACVLIGMVTGFIFLMVLLFVSGGEPAVDSVIDSTAGPLLQILYTSTNSKAGAICLLMFPLICLLFAATAIMTTSSRMTYAFARDGGLPYSRFFAKVHPKLGLPFNAILLTCALVVIFGCIFLGSSAALNAIVSASVVALSVSYGLPVAINVLQGRRKLPADRAFKMPEPLAWFANIVGIVYVLITSVLFLFPPDLPVTGNNMNYCVVAFAIVLIISMIQWYVDGKKNFHGPKIEMVPSGDVITAQESNGNGWREPGFGEKGEAENELGNGTKEE